MKRKTSLFLHGQKGERQGRVAGMNTGSIIGQIPALDTDFLTEADRKWDTRVKPPGSFGSLEKAVSRICAVQKTLSPDISSAAALLFAGDHHIIEEGVSNSLQEVTWQQTLNFSHGKGAFGLLCSSLGVSPYVVDVGVNHTFDKNSSVVDRKIDRGAANFLHEPALGIDGAERAIQAGRDTVASLDSTVKLIVPGEMGVGNTTSAAALTSLLLRIDSTESVGRGAGLNGSQLERKREVVSLAYQRYSSLSDPIQILCSVGGYEIAAMTGAMLEAAEKGIIILLDGYVASAALLAACRINENVSGYIIAGHLGSEKGQKRILSHLGLSSLLSLGMFPGEGAGALLSYPILSQTVMLFNSLESFDAAQVSDRANRILAGGSFS